MKNYLAIVLFLVLAVSFAAQAQPPVETDAPVATAEVTAPAVVTDPAPVATTAPDAPPNDSPAPSTGMNPDMVFVGIVLLFLVFGLADKFSNYRLSKELAAAVPADWKPALDQFATTGRRIVYERAGDFADSTESPIDNNLLDEQMKNDGWEFYIDAATGERHARKRLVTAG